MESKDEPAPAATSRGEEVTPAVEASEEIEMQVEPLQVASVAPTGSACQDRPGQRR
jgi:hypothetical protein